MEVVEDQQSMKRMVTSPKQPINPEVGQVGGLEGGGTNHNLGQDTPESVRTVLSMICPTTSDAAQPSNNCLELDGHIDEGSMVTRQAVHRRSDGDCAGYYGDMTSQGTRRGGDRLHDEEVFSCNVSLPDKSDVAPSSGQTVRSEPGKRPPQPINHSDVSGLSSQQTPSVKCSYVKDMCAVHGGPARLRWMPDGKIMGEHGRMILNKKYFYVCDLGPSGRRRRQTRLSFTSVRKEDNLGGHEDTRDGNLGQ